MCRSGRPSRSPGVRSAGRRPEGRRLRGRCASWTRHHVARVAVGRAGGGAVRGPEEDAGGRGGGERVAGGEDRGRAARTAAEDVAVCGAEGAVVVEGVVGVLGGEREVGGPAAEAEDAEPDGSDAGVVAVSVEVAAHLVEVRDG